MSVPSATRPDRFTRRRRGGPWRRVRIGTAAAAVLLLIALWLRSYRCAEAWVPLHAPMSLGLFNVSGGLFIFLGNGSDEVWTYQRVPAGEAGDEFAEPSWSGAGFGRYDHDFGSMLRIPHHVLLLAPLVLLTWPWVRSFQRVDPECGTVAGEPPPHNQPMRTWGRSPVSRRSMSTGR